MKILSIGPYPRVEILDVPVPEPGPGEALLRVQAVTTCPQWDLHLRHNEPMFVGHAFHCPYTPGQPGHEASGTIAALGEGVTGLTVGQRVSAWRDAGHAGHGCYAQYAAMPAENLIPIPDGLDFAAAAPLELAMCVGATFLVLKEMNVLGGRVVGITGLGPAGLIAAQVARAEGAAEVIGFDLSEERRRYAREHQVVGAAFNPGEAPAERFPTRPGPTTLETGIDCVGAKRSVEWLMDHVGDTVALFGVQREDYTFTPRHYHPMLRLCGYPGHSRAAADYALRLIEAGKLDLSLLVTHAMPLERYNEAIDLLETQQAIKVCFLPWQS